MKIISVVGARPNFMKIAPFIKEIESYNLQFKAGLVPPSGGIKGGIYHILVHTGQHYDDRMSEQFFKELGIPRADINLGIGSGTHAEQVGQTMIAFEKVLKAEKPDWVVVVGDVNATLACSVTAKKENIKCCHIEAGLRSGDMSMPEEINRMVTDRISDLLLTPDRLSLNNLIKEGVPEHKIRFAGNIMIDTLETNRDKASQLSLDQIINKNLLIPPPFNPPSGGQGGNIINDTHTSGGQGGSMINDTHTSGGQGGSMINDTHTSGGQGGSIINDTHPSGGQGGNIKNDTHPSGGQGGNNQPLKGPDLTIPAPDNYCLVTLHRPSNVDREETLSSLTDFLTGEVVSQLPVIWPIHPRTAKNLENFGLLEKINGNPGIFLLEPVGYLEMLRLNMDAKVMLTDSGGLQEECTVLGTPFITLRMNTERPITLTENGGVGVLAGNDLKLIREEFYLALKKTRNPVRPELWDGHTAERCLRAILGYRD